MKIDYEFLKNILVVMEENPKHNINNYELGNAIGLDFNKIDEVLFDKFVGHIKLLGDNNCIECKSSDYGFTFNLMSNSYISVQTLYRLTQEGYEFLEMIKHKSILEKIKNLSFSTAIEIGKPLLIEYLKQTIIG